MQEKLNKMKGSGVNAVKQAFRLCSSKNAGCKVMGDMSVY
jgi:hypothetical protein